MFYIIGDAYVYVAVSMDKTSYNEMTLQKHRELGPYAQNKLDQV